MTEGELVIHRYIFEHGGMPPLRADPETVEQAMKLWKACRCGACSTVCKYQNTTARFPDFISGGKGFCLGLIRASGEPFSWIDPLSGEPKLIPARIVALIAEAIKERNYDRKRQSKKGE